MWGSKILKGEEPGDIGYNPLGLLPTDPEEFEEIHNKEILNGRFAMISLLAMVAEELVTGEKLHTDFIFDNIRYMCANFSVSAGQMAAAGSTLVLFQLTAARAFLVTLFLKGLVRGARLARNQRERDGHSRDSDIRESEQ